MQKAMATEPRYFVWLASATGTMPQIWYGDQFAGSGRFKHNERELLFFRELKDNEYDMSLDDLRKKYPQPKVKEDAN